MSEPKNKKRKSSKVLLILLIILLILILAAVAGGFAIFNHYYRLSNYEQDPEGEPRINELPSDVQESLDAETLSPEDESKAAEDYRKQQEELDKKIRDLIPDYENRKKNSKAYNLLLIGVDRRDASWNGNSDAMILMTINYSKKTVMLTSFMRDTGVDIPGIGIRKLNHSYAVGGSSLLIRTLQQNFRVEIDNYAWIDFEGMRNVIDLLGGVDMKLTPQEAAHIGVTTDSAGMVHLDGAHALRHARDRSSGGYDYMRTQRQRNVLLAIASKARSGGLGDLLKTADAVLPYVHHNLDQRQLLSKLKDLPTVIRYNFKEQRVPYDNMYHFEGEMLMPDLSNTVVKLFDTMY